MSATITRDDWLKALSEAGMSTHAVDDQGAVTISEFAEMFTLPYQTARNKLARLIRAGRATETEKTVVNSYGRRVSMKAYRLT